MKNTKALVSLVLLSSFGCAPAFVSQSGVQDITALPASKVHSRNFDQVNETMSALTGVNISELPPVTSTTMDDMMNPVTTVGNDFIKPTGGGLKTELPSNNDVSQFSAANQGAVVRMAALYCDRLISKQSMGSARRPASIAALNTNIDAISEDFYNSFWGHCTYKPDLASTQTEVKSLMSDLQADIPANTTSADNYVKLTCSVFLASSCVSMF